MEQKGYYIFGDRDSKVKLKYYHKFYGSAFEVTFYGIDLANLLDLTGHPTLKAMEFEVYMEVQRDNGRIEEQIIQLTGMILNSSFTELKKQYLTLLETLSY